MPEDDLVLGVLEQDSVALTVAAREQLDEV
jgi:hypothetical protein